MREAVRSIAPSVRAAEGTEVAIRRILWACDFSACALDALRWVVPIGSVYGSEITALHVIPTTVPSRGMLTFTNPALLQPHLHGDVEAALRRYVAPAIAGSVPARVAVREGKAVAGILETAETLSADLVAMGTHGRGPLARSVIGSVAEAVIGRARCPVVTVPAPAAGAPGAGLPRTVLWATDFSSHATAALRYALSIAAKGGAGLVLVHAVEPAAVAADGGLLREGERRLRGVATGDRPPGRHVERVVVAGEAATEILRVAREREAGLVVMGTQGAGCRSVLFGSTVRRVVRDAPCPVLSLRG